MTRTEARNAMIKAGLTVHYDTGACGDLSHGSRLYFKAADSKLNAFGQPVERFGTISNLGKRYGWVPSLFNMGDR